MKVNASVSSVNQSTKHFMNPILSEYCAPPYSDRQIMLPSERLAISEYSEGP